ncbi:hypothetical protein GGR88_002731 [Sphingomonas jejuensis]|uniref:Uncharacterized protein n=1 Tax=Sphingomonas jejuensis TaxID=904715 RepID=A0ABX0XP96_9SPHN|nr:hypothetical protein [Sphingomonas jejuensis]
MVDRVALPSQRSRPVTPMVAKFAPIEVATPMPPAGDEDALY